MDFMSFIFKIDDNVPVGRTDDIYKLHILSFRLEDRLLLPCQQRHSVDSNYHFNPASYESASVSFYGII